MEKKFSGVIPLVVFTSLLPIAVGIHVGLTCAYFAISASPDQLMMSLMWSFVLTVTGGVAVLFHLGHSEKGLHAFRGLSHSVLSREVVLVSLFGLFLGASIFIMYKSGPSIPLLTSFVLSAVFGIMTVFAVGGVYNLPSQISWRGYIASSGPVAASVILASTILFILLHESSLQMNLFVILIFIVAIDVLFTLIRLKRFFILGSKRVILVFPKQRVLALTCYPVKIILMISAVFLLLLGYYREALFFMGYGVLLDRIGFYASAAMETPKERMAGIKEERMRGALAD